MHLNLIMHLDLFMFRSLIRKKWFEQGHILLKITGKTKSLNVYNRSGKCIPKVNRERAIIILILSFFFPGILIYMYIKLLGISTCIGGCLDDRGYNGSLVCLGILQLILTYVLIGYIWSIITAIMTLRNAYI